MIPRHFTDSVSSRQFREFRDRGKSLALGRGVREGWEGDGRGRRGEGGKGGREGGEDGIGGSEWRQGGRPGEGGRGGRGPSEVAIRPPTLRNITSSNAER